ncbi:Putative phage protein (fragment) [Weissella viridescens]
MDSNQRYTVPKTDALPLGHIPIINGGYRIRTYEPEGMDLQSIAFNQTSLNPHNQLLYNNKLAK